MPWLTKFSNIENFFNYHFIDYIDNKHVYNSYKIVKVRKYYNKITY